MNSGSFSPLKQMLQWNELIEFANQNNVPNLWASLSRASELNIKECVFHGDFTPWNIKVSDDSKMLVMDWEYGNARGPAGWDWLHYMIQRSVLVSKLSPGETLNACRAWAEKDEGQKFLADAGWGYEVELWIGTYLVYSSWITGFDREELILEWIGK